MPSNRWKISDYYQNLGKYTSSSPLLIEVKDEFVASVFRQKIKEGQQEFNITFGAEVTVEWLENEFLTMTLFSMGQNYLILDAHDIPETAVDFLSHAQIDWQQKNALFMATKNNKNLTKCFEQTGHYHRLELPPFWEMNQLLIFFANHFQLALAPKAQKLFVDLVEQTTRHYFQACQLLKNEYPQKSLLTEDDLQRVLIRNRLDQFALAQQLGEKNWRAFYTTLLGDEYTLDDLRRICSFLQSHVVKLLDPSYAKTKNRPSRYDRQIAAIGPKWSQKELLKWLQRLAQWELDCKLGEELKNQFRQGLFKSF